jgi:predicted enzyme related to lactoylglutathione lyase
MTSSQPPRPFGSILWQDLTVPNAERVRDFYARVAGWLSTDVDMGGYSDYNMHDADGKVVAGICHATGVNAKIPPQWLVYISVEDADASAQHAVEAGGTIVDGPRSMGDGTRFVVVKDPAGACCALISKPD